MTEVDYALPCPECDEPAIPPALFDDAGEPMWRDGDEAVCPGCGRGLTVIVYGGYDEDFAQAAVTNEGT